MVDSPSDGLAPSPQASDKSVLGWEAGGPLGNQLEKQFDVIIVGAGAAGLYSALCLPDRYRVAVLSKGKISRSASKWAQGGLAAVVSSDDSTDLHVTDTLKAGAGLCDRDAVEFLVTEASDCVASLVELGVAFDRDEGELAVTLEAAHSRRRVLHAADATGRAIVTVLLERVLERGNITVFDQTLALDVALDGPLEEGGRCRGVQCVRGDRRVQMGATAVILATGGGGQVFSKTTNPPLSTGDGVAIAHRAGAVLRDLEFIQFHPTALMHPGAPHFLISEAVRGEGAHLVDHTGHRFAFDYHPKGELAPRDVVSRAIFNHLRSLSKRGERQDCVWLDLRPIDRDRLQYRFPNILDFCKKHGLDPFNAPIPVAPAAHYWMGGIATDRHNQTSVPGLYAVGETSSTGVHGANRLASNSLLECIVFGAQFRHLDLPSIPQTSLPGPGPISSVEPPAYLSRDAETLTAIGEDLPHWVWHGAGISRDRSSLRHTLVKIHMWQQAFDAMSLTDHLTQYSGDTAQLIAVPLPLLRQWCEVRNLLAIACLILTSAEHRTESRGGHYRKDHPEPDPAWQTHIWIQGDRWWTASASAFATVPQFVP